MTVHGSSLIRFRKLSMRPQGDEWVIGRVEDGNFIAVPSTALRIIALLDEGHNVDSVAMQLRAEAGVNLAVRDFVEELDGLGFIDAVDGQPRPTGSVPRPSLPWLEPRHVKWTLRPAVAGATMMVTVAVVTVLAVRPWLIPSYHLLIWSQHPGVVLTVNAAIAWTLIGLHEGGHLVTARAAGVPSRVTLSTRLQFLAAQTDVSGVWAAPRRVRLTVYLAGIAVDLWIALTCLLILVITGPGGVPGRLLAVTETEALLAIPFELMIFMRTDIYFVVQDLAGCSNLYQDGVAYLQAKTLRLLGRGAASTETLGQVPPRERSIVRVYSAFLLAGTVACLAVEFIVSIPALVVLLTRAGSEIRSSLSGYTADGLIAILYLVAWQSAWAIRWWSKHGLKVCGSLKARSSRQSERR